MIRYGLALALIIATASTAQSLGGLEERIQQAPLTPDQRNALIASVSRKDFASMENVLQAAAKNAVQPGDAAAAESLLGALEFVGGRMREAASAFVLSDSRKPLDNHDRFTLAMALANLGDVEAARVQLKRLDEAKPDQPLYLYWLARLDYYQRLYEAAVEKLKRVVQLDPNSTRGYDNLGLCYDMMGLTAESAEAFEKAVTLNRKLASPSAWPPHNFGYLLFRLQRFPEAEQYLREALKYDPNFAQAHYHLARVLEKLKRDDAAIEEYKAAASLDGNTPEPLYSLGLLYRRPGRDDEAKRALAEYKRRKALAPVE